MDNTKEMTKAIKEALPELKAPNDQVETTGLVQEVEETKEYSMPGTGERLIHTPHGRIIYSILSDSLKKRYSLATEAYKRAVRAGQKGKTRQEKRVIYELSRTMAQLEAIAKIRPDNKLLNAVIEEISKDKQTEGI